MLGTQHGAVMLSMTAAAGGKPGVVILRKCESRRQERKREGSEQQDGEKATHQADEFSVRPAACWLCTGSFVCSDAGRGAARCGLL